METPAPSIAALHLGKVATTPSGETGEWWDKAWETASFKYPTDGAVWLGYEGFRGDEQADRKNHGGVDRAVCVYPASHYAYWREALDIPDLPFGAFGENLTLDGIDETSVRIGDRFAIGGAEVEVSQPRQPCWKLGRRWKVKDLAHQVEQTGFTGFYFRVVKHGYVRSGDRLEFLGHGSPWTVAHCHEVMYHRKDDAAAAGELAECPPLSGVWKDSLWLRAAKRSAE